jgi:hypothetical protein
VCIAAYLVFWRPRVTVFDEGLLITNPIEVVTIGWQDVELIDARFTMFVEHSGGQKVNAWAVSAPSRHGARRMGRSGHSGNSQVIRHLESPRSETGAALFTARRRKDAFDAAGNQSRISTTRMVQPGAVISLVVAVVATVMLLVL